MVAVEGLVLSRVGGRYRVLHGDDVLIASLRGRVKQHSEEQVLVGDRVSLVMQSADGATIERVLPRRSVLQRRSPGRKAGIRPVAANVDQVVAVGAVRRPDWDAHLMDRFLVVAEANQLPAVIVVNKADLDPAADAVLEPYRAAGYRTLVTSASQGVGLDALREQLAQRVSLFSGPTGAGKSSLLNAIQPGLRLRTGDVSRRAGSGRHTTVSAEMHALSGGGFVVDTPGLRDIGLWGLTPGDVADAFPELRRHAGTCRFDNCRHLEEPGCAVVNAVARAEIPAARLESYRIFLREAQEAAHPWN